MRPKIFDFGSGFRSKIGFEIRKNAIFQTDLLKTHTAYFDLTGYAGSLELFDITVHSRDIKLRTFDFPIIITH